MVNSVLHHGAASWADYNDDGLPDLLVASPSELYVNEGAGNFRAVFDSGMSLAPTGGVGWADYNNDGFLDVAMAVWQIEFRSSLRLFRGNGGGTFSLVTDEPMTLETGHTWSCAWGDYDNDGHLDLYIGSYIAQKNLFLHNNGDGTFTKLLTGSPANDPGAAGGPCAWADYDNDGDLDLVVQNGARGKNFLYRNNGSDNGWLKVKLIGTVSNRAAIGAKVRVKAAIGGKTFWQLREISSGDGYSGNSLFAHFGLGNATMVESIRIEWPSGIVQELSDVPGKQFLTVTEPPRLGPTVKSVDGMVELQVKSWLGFTYTIEATSNLKDWTRLGEDTNLTGTLRAPAPEALDPHRFFRLKVR